MNDKDPTSSKPPTLPPLLPSPPADASAAGMPVYLGMSSEEIRQQQLLFAAYQHQFLLTPNYGMMPTIPSPSIPNNGALSSISNIEEDLQEVAAKPAAKKKKGKVVGNNPTKKKGGTGSKNYKLKERVRLLCAVHAVKPATSKQFKKEVKPVFDSFRDDDEPPFDQDGKSLYEQYSKLSTVPKADRNTKYPGHEEVFELLDEYKADEGKRNGVRSTNPNHALGIDGLLADGSSGDDDDEKKKRERLRKVNEEKKKATEEKRLLMANISSSLAGIKDVFASEKDNASGGGPGFHEQVTLLKHDMEDMRSSMETNQKKTNDVLEKILAKLDGDN
jgi:hypothetical protein